MWQENCGVDLDYHLRRVQVPAPRGRRELDEVIGNVASSRRSSPRRTRTRGSHASVEDVA
jgi:hypothetical protein